MRSNTILASSALFVTYAAQASPLFERWGNETSANSTSFSNTTSTTPSATQILQFALTLEHLESTFYTEALSKFNETDFTNAGLPSYAYGRFKQIGEHEAEHVAFLTEVLGNESVSACNYSFPYTDPSSFAALSEMLESVGTSAYIGGAKYLASNPEALTAAGAILSTEARHATWIESVIFKGSPWSGPFDTPLDGNLVYTLATNFITSCPSTNPTLPFTAFPSLTITNSTGGNSSDSFTPGSQVNLTYNNTSSSNSTQYLAFFHGLNTTVVDITSNQATIPSELQGLVFAVVTTNNTDVEDSNIVAGPAALNLGLNATASN